MAKTVRKGVFETNSSSSHSISINKNENITERDTIIPDEYGAFTLTGGEFGWGWERFNDAETKANYFAVDNENSIERLEMLKEAIIENTDCIEVGCNYTTDWDSPLSRSYIDHDSHGTTNSCEIKTKEELVEWLFNKNSWLYIGNDNREAPANFFDELDVEYIKEVIFDIDIEVPPIKLKGDESSDTIMKMMEGHLERLGYVVPGNIGSNGERIYRKEEAYWIYKLGFWCSPNQTFQWGYQNEFIDFENGIITFHDDSIWDGTEGVETKELKFTIKEL